MEDHGEDRAGTEPEPLRLSRRVVWVWRTPALITALVVAAVAAVIGAGADASGIAPFVPALALCAAGVGMALVLPAWMFRRWSYWVTPDTVEIRHGVWMRVESSIPHFRVQHIDVHQGPLHRAFGVVELRISTASVTADAKLPGLTRDRAQRVRQLVLDRAQDDDAV